MFNKKQCFRVNVKLLYKLAPDTMPHLVGIMPHLVGIMPHLVGIMPHLVGIMPR